MKVMKVMAVVFNTGILQAQSILEQRVLIVLHAAAPHKFVVYN